MAFQPIRNATKPTPLRQAIDDFKQGVWRLVEDSRLPQSAVKEAVNLMQYQDGRWGKRPGTQAYGADMGDDIDGAFEYVKSDGSTELLAAAGGKLYRIAGQTKTEITGNTFEAGRRLRGLQIRDMLYLANGYDNLCYYDGTVLQTYTNVGQPTISSISRSGLSAGGHNMYYQVVALNQVGHSLPSNIASVSGGINRPRDNWQQGDKLTINWGAVAGASRYEIYANDDSGTTFFLDSVPSTVTSYEDKYETDGPKLINTYTEVPKDNTTKGPKFATMELSGNRIFATGDPDNPYRVYFGGTGSYVGAFSGFYGGGYIDLERGGRERPASVVHYRDGKGESQVTVFTSSPEGAGSIWQIQLVNTTVGKVTFPVPTPNKIVGSTGTNAPDTVVKAGDDVFFLNKRGAFSLGSRPNLLNVLSTREMTANIRPFIRNLNGSAFEGACGYYRDGRLYWSVPFGSAQKNTHIMVLDQERRNWNPEAFTIGVKSFFEHTDQTGVTRFLAIPTSGTRLLEISEDYVSDGIVGFDTSLLSGLYPVDKDRLKWARLQDVVFELFEPRGEITLQIMGNDRRRGFTSLASVTLSDDTTSNSGWGTMRFGAIRYGDSSVKPRSITRSSIKKRVRVNKLVNTWQYRITTTNQNASYTLLAVQPRGFIVPTRDPAAWRST